MNLSDYTLEELVKLKEEVTTRLYSISDGFLYLCKVRSYGRNWIERPSNIHVLTELCYQYNGDDGIVDVYTTNPDLNIDNYGDLFYIKSELDYNLWKDWDYLVKNIPIMEKQIEEWEQRDNMPFNTRPKFEPYFTRETILEYKKKLEEYDMSFTSPVSL